MQKEKEQKSVKRPLVWAALFVLLACFVRTELALARLPTEEKRNVTVTGKVIAVNEYSVILKTSSEKGNIQYKTTGEGLKIGDIVAVQGTLSPLQAPKNPGGYDEKNLFLYDDVIYTMKGEVLSEAAGRGSLLSRARAAFTERVYALWEGDEAAAVSGLLLGSREGLEEDTYDAFRRSGTAHLLAVSGLHMGFAAALALLILRPLRKNGWVQIVLALAFLAGYGVLTESGFSVLRAGIMTGFLLLARHFGRRVDGPSALSAAVIVDLCIHPKDVLRAGFLMSLGAVYGIFCLYAPIRRALYACRLPKKLGDALAISLAAQLGVLPAQVYFFGEISLVSPLVNLLAVPLSAIIVTVGLVSVLLSFVSASVAAIPAFAVHLAVKGLLWLCGKSGGLDFAAVSVPSPAPFALLAFAGLFVVVSPYFKEINKKKRWISYLCLGVCFALSVALWLPGFVAKKKSVKVEYLSVGTADCSLLLSDHGNVAIDTGWNGSEAVKALQSEGRTLDAVFITHADNDHAGGLVYLLENGLVERVYYPKGMSLDKLQEAADIAERNGVPMIEVTKGQYFIIGEYGLCVLWPESVREGKENADSLVLDVFCKGEHLLFLGDVTQETEEMLDLPACEAVKLAHHGSATSTSEALLDKAAPKTAILSVGKDNRYGFPKKEVTERLIKYGIPTYSTETGAIIAEMTDKGVLCEHFTPRGFWHWFFIG